MAERHQFVFGGDTNFGSRQLAVIDLLNTMARQFDTAIIVVTHDEKIIPTFRRLYNIRDGFTVEEQPGT